MMSIDINCDMGEGMGNDERIMPYISSASVACGYHAGDENTMRQTVDLCIGHNVAIGAHPSFPDKENFGRSNMNLPLDEVYTLVAKQVNHLRDMLNQKNQTLHHVKPHGALYNMSASDPLLAAIIAQAVKDIDSSLILYGLAGSCSLTAAQRMGLKTASEVFADRTYQDNASLTSRKQPGALIEDAGVSITQVMQMIKKKKVTSVSGKEIPITAETICIHGDGKNAVLFAKTMFNKLKQERVVIKAF